MLDLIARSYALYQQQYGEFTAFDER